MQLSGHLSEYSLAEIFNFVHQGNRTGLLSLMPEPDSRSASNTDYLWFERGRIVALANGLEGVELLTRIRQRHLVSSERIEPVANTIYQLQQPLGVHLKSLNLLDAAQLKLLFNSQTVVPTCRLFELKNRQFRFDPDRRPLNAELTGLSSPAREVGLLGLRLLKDWSGLTAKLPDPASALHRRSSQAPTFELNGAELKLWQLADGRTSLAQLATKMSLSVEIGQQIAFRLLTFDALDEVPAQSAEPLKIESLIPVLDAESNDAPIPTSLLGNLRKFLTGKRERSSIGK